MIKSHKDSWIEIMNSNSPKADYLFSQESRGLVVLQTEQIRNDRKNLIVELICIDAYKPTLIEKTEEPTPEELTPEDFLDMQMQKSEKKTKGKK